jgi:hypothetical protein
MEIQSKPECIEAVPIDPSRPDSPTDLPADLYGFRELPFVGRSGQISLSGVKPCFARHRAGAYRAYRRRRWLLARDIR